LVPLAGVFHRVAVPPTAPSDPTTLTLPEKARSYACLGRC
jgi:hypothetical protein